MIHTTGDFGIMQDVRFTSDAVASGIQALAGARQIYVDANMIRAGLSLPRLRQASVHYTPGSILCHIADPDVAKDAEGEGLPRSLFAVRKAKHALQNGIAVFGNSPVALLELNRMILEEGIRPALVVAMPVGFVHVEESKTELLQLDIPAIVLDGRRGGSTLAVSVIHALCSLAARHRERSRRRRHPGGNHHHRPWEPQARRRRGHGKNCRTDEGEGGRRHHRDLQHVHVRPVFPRSL